MPRPEPRTLTPAEQAETDATAEAVLAMLKRVLRPGVAFDRATHQAWLEAQPPHSEGCDCAVCLGLGGAGAG